MPYIIAIVLIVIVSATLIFLIDRYYHKRILALQGENLENAMAEFKHGRKAGISYVLDSTESHVEWLRDNRE